MAEFLRTDEMDELQLQTNLGRYLFASKFSKDRTVLDVACGSGYGSSLLGKSAQRVVGIDMSDMAITHAQSHYPSDAHFVEGDASLLPFRNNMFELVVSFETIEHMPSPNRFVRELARVLRPTGVLICSTPNKKVTSPRIKPRNPYHLNELELKEFHSLVSTYFTQTRMFGQHILPHTLRIPATLLHMLPLNEPTLRLIRKSYYRFRLLQRTGTTVHIRPTSIESKRIPTDIITVCRGKRT